MDTLDTPDRRILTELQGDGRLTNAVLAERVHLSASQTHRRTRKLEEAGIIVRYAAILDAEQLGLDVVAFVSVALEQHSDKAATSFREKLATMQEVLACYAVTGEADYLLQVVAPDLKAFSEFLMHRLMRLPGVRSVQSSVVLERIKETSTLPLSHLQVR
ncbi:MAG TPA: Lrp/AsnC family transcriptional regulator [Rhizomicrobium sp.]|jgi:Lrp/AsnC family leucine-responsive transcriptional regulator|nr:Lrp/AsnC family transcriptional regulator [Rhizomicrobium sp.]